MKIIEPSANLIFPPDREGGIAALRFIEQQARISHRSEESQTEDSWKRFIDFVVCQRGDMSVIEHSMATVVFRVDRGITHELVRHRHFSFTHESTRFVRYGGKFVQELEFIKPISIEDPQKFVSSPSTYAFLQAMTKAEEAYFSLLEYGSRPQEARSVLPNALASTIAMTGNFRAWRGFFMQRVTREAHPDMRRVAIPLLVTFQERVPLLFDDIVPEEAQSISMARLR